MKMDFDPIKALDEFIRTFSFAAERGLLVRDLPNHPVHSRADRRNSAAYFTFDRVKTLEAHISEILPGQATRTHRHNCEAVFYVLTGRGRTILWAKGEPKRQIEWRAGDLFTTPVQHWHRHINVDSLVAARYLEITNIPLLKSLGLLSIEGPKIRKYERSPK